MIKVKYDWINNGAVSVALNKLCNVPTFDIKSAYSLGKIHQKIESEMRHGREIFMKLLRKHCELDEKGEVKWTDKGEWTVLPDHSEEFEKEEKELLAIEVQIHRTPISIGKIEAAMEKLIDQKMKITPKELALLEPLIDMSEGA